MNNQPQQKDANLLDIIHTISGMTWGAIIGVSLGFAFSFVPYFDLARALTYGFLSGSVIGTTVVLCAKIQKRDTPEKLLKVSWDVKSFFILSFIIALAELQLIPLMEGPVPVGQAYANLTLPILLLRSIEFGCLTRIMVKFFEKISLFFKEEFQSKDKLPHYMLLVCEWSKDELTNTAFASLTSFALIVTVSFASTSSKFFHEALEFFQYIVHQDWWTPTVVFLAFSSVTLSILGTLLKAKDTTGLDLDSPSPARLRKLVKYIVGLVFPQASNSNT